MIINITCLLVTLLSHHQVVAFHCSGAPHLANRVNRITTSQLLLASNDEASETTTVAVRASQLDESMGLTSEERTVVNIHRVCSPSVVYVTSVLKPMGGGNSDRSKSRSQRWRRGKGATSKQKEEDENNDNKQQKLPRGTALGSGSGFVIDSAGYVVTNYHVIQQAYEANDAVHRYDTFWDNISKNVTKRFGGESKDIERFINGTINAISRRESLMDDSGSISLPAQVFVRFGSNGNNGDGGVVNSAAASFHACEIVDVVKELDVAVLKIINLPSSPLKQLSYGSSSDLLVGQSLLAIGNPFGLDRTITSGLVSALGRSVTGVAGNDIKNCIQTDAAINPGNSGGPLLNLNGEVVGVNTMIITTSGSSAGIGFAVPSNDVKDSTDSIIEIDKERQLQSTNRKGRGWLGVEVAVSSLEDSLKQRLSARNANSADEERNVGAFVTAINANSPLLQQGENEPESTITTSTIDTTSIKNGNIHVGERIVNVGSTSIANGREFVVEMKQRVEGENLSLTVENKDGEKKVVYVTLGRIPL